MRPKKKRPAGSVNPATLKFHFRRIPEEPGTVFDAEPLIKFIRTHFHDVRAYDLRAEISEILESSVPIPNKDYKNGYWRKDAAHKLLSELFRIAFAPLKHEGHGRRIR